MTITKSTLALILGIVAIVLGVINAATGETFIERACAQTTTHHAVPADRATDAPHAAGWKLAIVIGVTLFIFLVFMLALDRYERGAWPWRC